LSPTPVLGRLKLDLLDPLLFNKTSKIRLESRRRPENEVDSFRANRRTHRCAPTLWAVEFGLAIPRNYESTAMLGRFTFCAFLSIAVSLLVANRVSAQGTTSSFERCLAYLNATEELGTKFRALQDTGTKLISERQDTLNRLIESRVAVEQLLQAQAFQAMLALESAATEDAMGASLQTELANQAAQQAQVNLQDLDTKFDVRYSPQERFSLLLGATRKNGRLNEMGSQLASQRVQYDLIQHQMQTLNEAQRINVERHFSLIKELEKIAAEMQAWEQKPVASFFQYWELADIAGVRSDVELRLALRQLQRDADSNPGAAFMRGITLLRLGEYDEANSVFESLSNIPRIQLVVLAAQGEVFMRQGEKNKALALLRQTVPAGLKDVRVRMQRAQAYAAGGDLKTAEIEWEAVLKLGGHEIAAHRAIAFINASQAIPNRQNKLKAAQNSHLASQLAGEDWACELAVALSAAANGEKQKGSDAARNAAAMAIGNHQAYCDDIAEQIDVGTKVAWGF
jgi:tetratricopeptide (TPR) repeat protein